MNKIFIKIGDYRFATDQIVCIRVFPSGCRVYLKTGTTMDIVDMDNGDWEVIKAYTIQLSDMCDILGEEDI